MLARHCLQQHTELIHDALSLESSLRRHHPHYHHRHGNIFARLREVGRTMLVAQDLVVDSIGLAMCPVDARCDRRERISRALLLGSLVLLVYLAGLGMLRLLLLVCGLLLR